MSNVFNRPGGFYDTNYNIDPNAFSDEEFRGEYSSDNLIYKGFARPGGNEDEAVWQIAYLTYDSSGNVLTIQWPLVVLEISTSVSQDVGTLTTPWTTFSGTLTPLPIVPGTVVITAGAITFTDILKNGTLSSSGSNTGTISYDSGDIVLNFSPALLMDTEIDAIFQLSAQGNASNDYAFIWSQRHSYTYV